MPEYIVKDTDLKVNGKIYREGSTVELTAAEAKELEQFVSPAPASEKSSQAKTPAKDPEQTKEPAKDPDPSQANTGDKK